MFVFRIAFLPLKSMKLTEMGYTIPKTWSEYLIFSVLFGYDVSFQPLQLRCIEKKNNLIL